MAADQPYQGRPANDFNDEPDHREEFRRQLGEAGEDNRWHQWREIGLGGPWAARGETEDCFQTLEDAVACATRCGWAVINAAFERSKFVVKRIEDPTRVCFESTAWADNFHNNGPWRVLAAPWGSGFGWAALEGPTPDYAAGGESASVHEMEGPVHDDVIETGAQQVLSAAKAAASEAGWTVVNEATARGKCVVRALASTPRDLFLAPCGGGPWRVHRAPVSVVVGLGCSDHSVQKPRLEGCFRAMIETRISSLLWVGSETEYRDDFPGRLGLCSAALAGAPGQPTWRHEIDTRSRTTQGNARFCMELLRDRHCYPGAVVRLVVVTSDFHMERSRLIFERAAQAILFPAGHPWLIECYPCETPENAPERYRAQAESLEGHERHKLWEGHYTDDQVRRWL